MDEYRSNAMLRQFHTRSLGRCVNMPGRPTTLNINFYTKSDQSSFDDQKDNMRFIKSGTSQTPSGMNVSSARKTAQKFMASRG